MMFYQNYSSTFNQGGEQSKLYKITQQGQINIEIS